MFNLQKIGKAKFLLPKEGMMLVPGLIIANESMLDVIKEDKSIDQVKNVATLKGIQKYSIAMPDIHWGYGFPIGGVAAMDIETGVISPGGVGYDINCGVRIALLPVKFSDIKNKGLELLKKIFEKVPSGVGFGRRGEGLSDSDFKELTEDGINWSLKKGFAFKEDIEHIESSGKIENADIEKISFHAKERGRKQLGTIGSGNHFIEIGEVKELFLEDLAKDWKIEKNQTYILIHTGSRGFGHQVCQDTLNHFIKKGYAENLPDRQLVCAPINSDDGRNYFSAMAAAANFAFNNRQYILHMIREAVKEILKIDPNDVKLLYDVCHNIAKFEEHEIDGKIKKVCVHRKGATRAFGPKHKELSSLFQKTGQPVLVPGDMGTSSYILAGLGNMDTFCSSCHGAGRRRSRTESIKAWRGKDIKDYMRSKGVEVLARSFSTVAEEMPDAYKDIDEVVNAVEEANLAKKVAKLVPSFVIKG